MESVLEDLDWVVLGIYFALLMGVAFWVVLQKNKNFQVFPHVDSNLAVEVQSQAKQATQATQAKRGLHLYCAGLYKGGRTLGVRALG